MSFRFSITREDSKSRARAGKLLVNEKEVLTPVFMPVGTQGAVRGLTPHQLKETGSTIVLANTYHLALRPGEGLIQKVGGLHKFMAWSGPLLTDSGGYQIMSLPSAKVTDAGVTFKSPVEGNTISLRSEEHTSELQ